MLYDVSPSPETVVALDAGAEYFYLGLETSLSGGTIGDVSNSINESWTFPVLAARF